MIDIWKQEMEVMKKGSIYRELRNKMRQDCEEDDCYLDKYCPFKRAHCQVDRDEELVTTSDHIRFKVNFFQVVQIVW